MEKYFLLSILLVSLVSHTNSQRTLNQQLIDAARIGDEDQVKLLLENFDIDVNESNANGVTVLMEAVNR